MILRIQTSEGTKRIEIDSDASTKKLYEMVYDSFGLKSFSFMICKDRRSPESSEIKSTTSRDIKSYSLKNGELLFIVPVNNVTLFESVSNGEAMDVSAPKPVQPSVQNVSKLSVGIALPPVKKNVLEDEVDRTLEHETGRIERGRDAFCQHGTNSRCVRCSALEPFDEKYLAEHNIKHMSFHASLRKLGSTADRGKYAQLDDIMCTLKPGCPNHPPDLEGGCPRCRPGAITLNRQPYRHVDNVEFENPQIVERFLNYWRITGNQRAGHLYGWYKPHKDVPLGIKAVVAAIYEPPQQNRREGIKFLDDPMEETVNTVAKEFGLQRVGWIFTDLVTEDPQKGTVKNFRNKETFFLSAQECILAGKLQAKHPNPCKYSSEGRFGSKFTTVCVTGDENHQVHMEGYQVSNQCMSLARDNVLIPTRDAPELGYVREPEKNRYVPDVFYKEKDEYGNEISKIARPFPVEYLLVDVPVATPLEPVYTFHVLQQGSSFPVENRSDIGETQDLMSLQSYLKQFEPGHFLEAASDFHFLVYITSIDLVPIKENIKHLIDAIKAKDMLQAYHWREEQPWATLEQLLQENVTGLTSSDEWTCKQCTYINQGRLVCDMCGYPKD
ncbi:nuclear protein localization protein 4 homolog isoform X2 [Artemia franciscana]|uniref:nuclear protein localization protein 4 homolog isoform X2 n=1 Tax=Artemia franciscana TaxID=6661 RepID=UPI0032DB4067